MYTLKVVFEYMYLKISAQVHVVEKSTRVNVTLE